jgi:maltose alpha-D-glucosyltransferase / alpha-amylase
MSTATSTGRRPTGLLTEPEWYRDAIIYELHIRAFADFDGDGIGDLAGLLTKLDYLRDLGVTAIWLLPFYPSPQRDGGYDIADFRRVDPVYGDLRTFRRVVTAAHDRGMRVITELVLNHTSDQHPWFQRARRAPKGSRWRNFYVWSDTPDRYREARIIFQDFETSNWTWDPVAGEYFWHRFYSHQPDLNYDNPEVADEMMKVLDHWMDLGVDGVRLDAVPYLFEREGTSCENLPETHAFLRKLRKHVDRHYADRLLLAEANQWPEDAAAYFGAGDECHMNFHFPLMPRLFMAVRQENRMPVIDILEQTPELPKGCQWATFLRNHDELTLEMVTDEERDYMYRAYAADPQMRLNLGIRRRLAPLLGSDRRKIELLTSLLFAVPGTPVLYYGDEIGMGDNVYLGDRDGVRTPMQWSPDRNAGFSQASSQRLYLPLVADSPYHYETVNVENQRNDPHSLLSWTRQLISVRCRHAALSRGDITFIDPDNHRVLAFVRQLDDHHPFLVVANLSARAQSVELDLRAWDGTVPTEVFGASDFAPITEWPYYLTLAPYGFYWFELTPRVAAHDEPSEFTPAALDAGWPAALEGRSPQLQPALAAWIRRRRWFAGKSRTVSSIRVIANVPAPGIASARNPLRICFVQVDYLDGDPDVYVVPLTVVDGERAHAINMFRPESVIAVLDGDHPTGGLHVIDAMVDEASALALLRGMAARRTTYETLRADPYAELRAALRHPDQPVRILSVEQSNTSIAIDDSVMFKLMRRLHGGVNPDLEITRHLRDVGFERTAQLYGSLSWNRRRGSDGDTVAIAAKYVHNEGSGWDRMLDLVGFFYEDSLSADADPPPTVLPAIQPIVTTSTEHDAELHAAGPELTLLGQRTAELHLALADSRGDPAFSAEPFSGLYLRSLYQGMRTQLRGTLSMLRRQRNRLDERSAALAERVLTGSDELLAAFDTLRTSRIEAVRTRTHGDFHLGQVLFTGRDFVIIDFEGEPARAVGERRIKHSPLRDVAGMVRSLDYAARFALHTRRERGLLAEHQEAASQAWSAWWPRAAANAYLAGYLTTPGIDDLLPRDPLATDLLLSALVLEKALYEVRYELDNRPAWAWLPLRVLAERIGGAS